MLFHREVETISSGEGKMHIVVLALLFCHLYGLLYREGQVSSLGNFFTLLRSTNVDIDVTHVLKSPSLCPYILGYMQTAYSLNS